MLLSSLVLAAALGSGDPALARARADLSATAARIEHLKARRLAGEDVGRELERLLVRAQDLAMEIESREPFDAAPAEVVPTAAELRERADGLRDEADGLEAALNALDIRIEDVRRAGGLGPGMASAAVGTPGGVEAARLRALVAERAAVASRLGAIRAGVSALEAAARRAEAEESLQER